MIVVPVTVKAEAGDSLEPRNLRPAMTTEQNQTLCPPCPPKSFS